MSAFFLNKNNYKNKRFRFESINLVFYPGTLYNWEIKADRIYDNFVLPVAEMSPLTFQVSRIQYQHQQFHHFEKNEFE
jgi:hypothetical protein